MRTFLIDLSNNDIIIGADKNITLADDKAELRQAIERILSTAVGEYKLNNIFGLDYKYIQAKQLDIERVEVEVTRAINQEARVKKVNYINVSFDKISRKLSIDFSIDIDNETLTGGVVV